MSEHEPSSSGLQNSNTTKRRLCDKSGEQLPDQKRRNEEPSTADEVKVESLIEKLEEVDTKQCCYFKNAMHCPLHFVTTKKYIELKQLASIESLFGQTRLVPLQLVGPKGVGKSTCLYALAIGMTIEQEKQNNNSEDYVTPLYFTDRSITKDTFLNNYLTGHKLPNFELLADAMIYETGRRFVVCIDIGRHNDKESGDKLIRFFNSLLGHHTNIRIIIAHSSGEGIDQKHKNFFQDLKPKCGRRVELMNFDDHEVKQYIEAYGLKCEFPALRKITNFNPLLLDELTQTQEEHWYNISTCSIWENKYLDILKSHFESAAMKKIEILTGSTFDVLKNMSNIDSFAERLWRTDYFLYYASTGHSLPLNEHTEFLNSWVYSDGHCYISGYEGETFTIALNFPGSDVVISEHIVKLVEQKKFSAINGTMVGFMFQAEFYSACKTAKSFTISFDKESATFNLNACCPCKRINIPNVLTTGFLYQLFSTHPAIDFVGEFIGNNTTYLVMFQVSVSPYVKHHSKVEHLNERYPKYSQFKEKTVLEHYKSSCNSTKVKAIFVYVSAAENDIPKVIKEKIKRKKLDISLGTIVESSLCPISNVIARFRRISM